MLVAALAVGANGIVTTLMVLELPLVPPVL
jgi:hypothetical protein